MSYYISRWWSHADKEMVNRSDEPCNYCSWRTKLMCGVLENARTRNISHGEKLQQHPICIRAECVRRRTIFPSKNRLISGREIVPPLCAACSAFSDGWMVRLGVEFRFLSYNFVRGYAACKCVSFFGIFMHTSSIYIYIWTHSARDGRFAHNTHATVRVCGGGMKRVLKKNPRTLT